MPKLKDRAESLLDSEHDSFMRGQSSSAIRKLIVILG